MAKVNASTETIQSMLETGSMDRGQVLVVFGIRMEHIIQEIGTKTCVMVKVKLTLNSSLTICTGVERYKNDDIYDGEWEKDMKSGFGSYL